MVSNIFYFHPYLGKWSNLINIFQLGWNHQLLLMAEIPNNHLRWCWNLINNGKNYQPQLVNAGFLGPINSSKDPCNLHPRWWRRHAFLRPVETSSWESPVIRWWRRLNGDGLNFLGGGDTVKPGVFWWLHYVTLICLCQNVWFMSRNWVAVHAVPLNLGVRIQFDYFSDQLVIE